MRLILLFLLLQILSLSCSLDPIISDRESLGDFYAYSSLITGKRVQVLLGKTVPENPPVDIDNARVTMGYDSFTVPLSYAGDGLYCDINDELIVQPGQDYELSILLPDKKTIEGKTTIPGTFDIIYPTENDTVFYDQTQPSDTLRFPKISWSESEGAHAYVLSLQIENDDSFQVFSTCVTTFRTQTFLPEIILNADQILKREITAKGYITVAAVDSFTILPPCLRSFLPALYDYDSLTTYRDISAKYLQEYNDNQARPSSNLTNALGVFNSIHLVRREIWLKIFIG